MKKSILLPFRIKFLLIIVLVAVIPVITISVLISTRLSASLQKQNEDFYLELLGQVASNIDFYYHQYSMSFFEITRMENFQKRINAPRFKSRAERRAFAESIGEMDYDPKSNSVKRAVISKIDGDFFLVELDKGSWYNDEYNINSYTASPYEFNMEALLNEPLYGLLKSDPDRKMAFGMLRNRESLTMYSSEDRPVLFYPYYDDGSDDFSKFILVMLNTNFLRNLYNSIERLSFGTLYIIDETGTLVEQSHPSSDDYYEFDNSTGTWIDSEEEENKLMSLSDYRRLNTDPEILSLHSTRLLIYGDGGQESPGNVIRATTVSHNGITYLALMRRADLSQCKLLFFLPINHVLEPVSSLRWIIGVVTIFFILVILVLGILLSRYVTGPVQTITRASIQISQGSYPEPIQITTRDEIQMLGEHFNMMVANLKAYQERALLEQSEKQKVQEVTILTLAKLAEYHDVSTGKHLERVSKFTRLICNLLVQDKLFSDILNEKTIDDISLSSILHDIGKIGIESAILKKEGPLTPKEFAAVQKHAKIGGNALELSEQTLGQNSFLAIARDICYYHHEWWDGSGYPFKLSGENIPLPARIVSLTDTYDALTSQRCYQKPRSHEEAISILRSENGHFDPVIFSCLLKYHERFKAVSIKNRD
jgi:HD-GYP domain-containing protein (c-di-GMP phosphodiesterase class II)